MLHRPTLLTGLAGAAVITACSHAAEPTTSITEMVLYGVDADTHELLRYTFNDDKFDRIGLIVDQNGFVLDHPECLTYIPSGPNKGFYATSRAKDGTGGPDHTLAKIDGLTANCYVYPSQNTYKGHRGMTVMWDTVKNDWVIIAIAHNSWDMKLIVIDPATGANTLIFDLDDSYGEYEGLSGHPTPGMLFAITGDKLLEIDLATGVVTQVGDHTVWARTESLELALGDGGIGISIPGVPAEYTKNGALFCFSDSENKMLIYNGEDGSFVEYACAFDTVDCEGLVFMTKAQDPFGMITVEACD